MPRRRSLPPTLAQRPFATADALTNGLGEWRLRADDLARPFHGVRVTHPFLPTVDCLAFAYATLMPAEQFFSHLTAAHLLGLRLPERPDLTSLHVSTPAPGRAPRRRGLIGHQLAASIPLVTVGGGLRCSGPVATWIMLGATLSLDDLIVMGDGLIRRQTPLASMSELEVAVAARAGCPGASRLRETLSHLRTRTDSARETMLRLMIVRAGFPEPLVNHEIRNEYGAFVALGDLAYPEYRVLLEYDGGDHRTDEKQFHRDITDSTT